MEGMFRLQADPSWIRNVSSDSSFIPRKSSPEDLAVLWKPLGYCFMLGSLFILKSLLRYVKTDESFKKRPPIVASYAPCLEHTLAFAYGGSWLFELLKSQRDARHPRRFRLFGVDINLISASDLRKISNNPHALSDGKLRARFVKNVFGLHPTAAKVIESDDSGTALTPASSSTIPPERRILRGQQLSTFDFLQSPNGVETFLTKFNHFLGESLNARDIGQHWTNLPDLYPFIKHVSSAAVISALCGPRLLECCPDFLKNFWIFDDYVHELHLGLPRFLIPHAHKARTSCLDALMKWKTNARRELPSQDPDFWDDWNALWGLKVMRARDQLYDEFEEYRTQQARASSDLGIIWASNDNLVPVAFWFVHAIVSSPTLRQQSLFAMHKAQLPNRQKGSLPRFNTEALLRQLLLQSIYHEVLRMQVSSLIMRNVDNDVLIDDVFLRKGSYALTVPWAEHNDESMWQTRTSNGLHPLTEFWAERFLSDDGEGSGKIFSLKGLHGTFHPFGLGSHTCPGRYFAARAIFHFAAVFLTQYEIEPTGDITAWEKPGYDPLIFGYTAFRTVRKMPFRIKLRG